MEGMSKPTESKTIRWKPLESNPQTLNTYIQALGVPKEWEFNDVYGLDPELLSFVPGSCCAFILLFPITENYNKHCLEEVKAIESNGQKVDKDVFYMKQTIGNACGTIGVIHAIANSQNLITLAENSPLKSFFNKVKGSSPADIGKALESDESLATAHTDCAQEGQTATLSAETPLDLHFIALVQKEGCIYELDGRKQFPVNHGPSSPESFKLDAAEVCKKFMARDPSEPRFSIIALSKS